MNPMFRSVLTRYQNYLLEFYQLIEDKEIIDDSDVNNASMVKEFLENLPEFSNEFEIEMQIISTIEDLQCIWLAQFSDDGFSVRAYTISDIDESEGWFFHYHDGSKEFEGNLLTDGDWDLFLEEIAELDTFGEKTITASFNYQV